MLPDEYFSVNAMIEGQPQTIELRGLRVVPSVGDEVHLDYWRGQKISFVVETVRHHISDIADKTLQQVSIYGRPI